MDIKTEVLNYIKKHEGASYVELERLFDKLGFAWQGNFETCSSECENVVFWYGWNVEAIEIINSLQRDGLIEKEPAHPIIYLIDGKCLKFPIVKNNKRYKTPHWLPVVFVATHKSLEEIIKELEQEVGI